MKYYYPLLLTFFSLFSTSQAQNYTPTEENLANRQQFTKDRFGIFLHWGLYSIFGQGEWYLQNAPLDRYEYAKSMNAFYPHDFNADQWVKAIKASGARYITLTTRHHDGFSLWHTEHSDYNVARTPFKRDVVKEMSEACQRHGIALHLYYSHIDWTRDDYPTGRTGLHTGKNKEKEDWASYYRFMNNQLTELLTKYSPIRAIWFDGWWDHAQDSIPFNWQLPEQYALIHKLRPDCLIGNNHHQTPVEGEDIQIFERDIPGENKAGLSGQSVSLLPLETCETMNGMWGYKVKDQDYKSPHQLIALLVRTAAKGANLLLNIGPQPDGNLPSTALERLSAIGKWMRLYGTSIYDTESGPLIQGEEVVSTRKGNQIYLHVLSDSLTQLNLACSEQIAKIHPFQVKHTLKFSQKRGRLYMKLPPQIGEDHRVFTLTLKQK